MIFVYEFLSCMVIIMCETAFPEFGEYLVNVALVVHVSLLSRVYMNYFPVNNSSHDNHILKHKKG